MGKSAGWVKGKAVGVWSGGKSDGWVKGKAVGVWSDKKNRRPSQKESPRSVVWKEKTPPGSKRKPSKCGLTKKNAAWVKEEALGVWSGKKNRRLGQRESHRSVAWKEKPPLGSKKLRPKKPDNKK